MCSKARTPEELETMFEDALLIQDSDALEQLLKPDVVLVCGDGFPTYDGQEIVRRVLSMECDGNTYVADPQQIIQSRGIALIISRSGVNVASRGPDGAWRYTIIFLSTRNGSQGDCDDTGREPRPDIESVLGCHTRR